MHSAITRFDGTLLDFRHLLYKKQYGSVFLCHWWPVGSASFLFGSASFLYGSASFFVWLYGRSLCLEVPVVITEVYSLLVTGAFAAVLNSWLNSTRISQR